MMLDEYDSEGVEGDDGDRGEIDGSEDDDDNFVMTRTTTATKMCTRSDISAASQPAQHRVLGPIVQCNRQPPWKHRNGGT